MYGRKVPVIKQVDRFGADSLIKMGKIICAEYALSSKIVSDINTNFISEKFKTSAKGSAYIMQYHHHAFIKAMDKKKYA